MLLEEGKILKIKQVLLVRRKRVGPFLNLLLFTRKYTSANLKSLQCPCSVEVKISEMWKIATLWQESLCTHTHTRTLAFIFIQLFPDNTNHQILVRRWDRLLLHYSQFWKLLSKNLGINFCLVFLNLISVSKISLFHGSQNSRLFTWFWNSWNWG